MTQQIKDKLIYEGRTYKLNEEIMEPYFKEFPDRKPESKGLVTSLWRGYVATFEIRDAQLFVKRIETFEGMSLELFPQYLGQLELPNNKFEWYSGLIRIDDFKRYWNDEEADATFEFLEIYKGDLVQKRVMNYDELQVFKQKQFDYFKGTAEYKKAIATFRERGSTMSDSELDDIIWRGLLSWYTREVFDNEEVNP